MKKVIFVSLLIAIGSPQVASSAGTQQTSDDAVTLYLSALRSKSAEILSADRSTPTKTHLRTAKRIARQLFVTTEIDPIAKENEILRIGLDMAREKPSKDKVKPGYLEKQILETIKKNESTLHFGLVAVPYFLVVRAIDVREDVRLADSSLNNFKMTQVVVRVISVMKGARRFKIDDTLAFFFFPFWFESEEAAFNASNDYLVLLEPRDKYPITETSPLALVTYIDESKGYYPIRGGGTLQDKTNLFGLGSQVNVDAVQKKIEQTIQDIRTW